jgi:PAS domain-containing protein
VTQHEIELILMRELASSLAMAVFVVGPNGDLLYYNEPAEHLLGSRFEETGALAMEEWASDWDPVDADGIPIPEDALPLAIAVNELRPAHGSMWIRGHDGQVRRLEVTAIPIVGQSGRHLGAAAVFWEGAGPCG